MSWQGYEGSIESAWPDDVDQRVIDVGALNACGAGSHVCVRFEVEMGEHTGKKCIMVYLCVY